MGTTYQPPLVNPKVKTGAGTTPTCTPSEKESDKNVDEDTNVALGVIIKAVTALAQHLQLEVKIVNEKVSRKRRQFQNIQNSAYRERKLLVNASRETRGKISHVTGPELG